jgi:hypothetical protein
MGATYQILMFFVDKGRDLRLHFVSEGGPRGALLVELPPEQLHLLLQFHLCSHVLCDHRLKLAQQGIAFLVVFCQ